MQNNNPVLLGILSVVALVGLIGLLMWAIPNYSVWQQGLSGQAELARAEENRKIKIEEAKAVKESATLYAEAEVERAKGVAEANKIIANGLGGPEGYLRYLWIQHLADDSSKIVYVPTEAQIPIMEAGRTPKSVLSGKEGP